MITFARIADRDYIRGIFLHPDVWPWVSDDDADPDQFEPLIHPSVAYLAPECDGFPMGCLMLQSINAVTLELHSALLPAYRGKHTLDVFRALVDYLPKTFPSATYLRTWVPSYNRPALLAARRVGFVERGVEPNAYLKHGATCDLHLFGVTL